jgi:hypothetical protein
MHSLSEAEINQRNSKFWARESKLTEQRASNKTVCRIALRELNSNISKGKFKEVSFEVCLATNLQLICSGGRVTEEILADAWPSGSCMKMVMEFRRIKVARRNSIGRHAVKVTSKAVARCRF